MCIIIYMNMASVKMDSGIIFSSNRFELDTLSNHYYIIQQAYKIDNDLIVEDVNKDELMCPICIHLLTKPIITNCSHKFCEKCLNDILLCPMCNTKIIDRTQLKSFEEKINTLHYKCSICNTDHLIGKMEHAENKLLCRYCFNTYDNEELFRTHFDIACTCKLVKCNLCNKIGVNINLRNHKTIHHSMPCCFN
jgi:hypothetical protein